MSNKVAIRDFAKLTWLQHREAVAVVELEGQDVEDAITIIDAKSGRMLAFIGPKFPPEHRLAGVEAHDLAELAALFEHVDEWFAPRLRGLIIGTVYSIQHGWSTVRDARAVIGGGPLQMLRHQHGRRFLNLLVNAGIELANALDAFPTRRGRWGDETRKFLLEELTRIAADNGMPLDLPQDRDQRDGGVTPFFTFVLAVIELILDRVDIGAGAGIRQRANSFRWSRIALLHALDRVKKTRKTNKLNFGACGADQTSGRLEAQ